MLTTTKFKDKAYLSGLVMLVVSFALFCVPSVFPYFMADSMGLFFIHYAMAAAYFFMLLFTKRLKKGKGSIHVIMIFLILFLISAYALNRQMDVFEKSAPWFMVLLVISCVNILLFEYLGHFYRPVRLAICFILGITMVVFIYLSLYLLPLYVLGAGCFFVLGISLHTFVPLLFCIYIFVLVKRTVRWLPGYLAAFCTGAGIAVVLSISFIIYWCVLVAGINSNYRRSSVTGDSDLSSWLRVAQYIPHNPVSERILKSGLVYSVADLSGDNWLWRMPSMNFGEEKKHDPLVMMGSFFSGKISIPEEERIKILEAIYDSRHQAQERLWSGDDLLTEYVNTDVHIWPELRIAYTELNITVSNLKNNAAWRRSEEAIYTFHVPEGGVVTSLSLWIAGKEAKGVLTTKAKADSAYKTIVGVERRDPSVVHWQEGNTVSVRVFPVLSGQSRMFKLGVTAPLNFRSGKLAYEPVYFDGPSVRGAEEDIAISFMKQPVGINMPSSFDRITSSAYKRSGNYKADWQLSFDAPPVRANNFSFDGKSFHISELEKHREKVTFSHVYLDINAAWSDEECNKVYELVKDKKVWVASSSDNLEQMTAVNKEVLFDQLRKQYFSLFPFYKIRESNNALVISKSSPASPSIAGLKDSPFLTALQEYFSNPSTLRLYNLGNDLSPYLRSLKEFRAFRYEQGDLIALKGTLADGSFPDNIENDQQVVINNAGISIAQTGDSLPSDAPDHLMRLFAYNHILKKSGTGLLSKIVAEDELVAEAERAYVVSPVSSLVVLETREDYDRFTISGSKNSLQNASSKSKGAVPEPHEWALLIIVLATLLYAGSGSRISNRKAI